jgi:hypothetical protein
MQPGEGQLRLGLETVHVDHLASRRPPDEVVQQRRLADPGLAAHHQRPALARPDGIDESIE